jgi:cerevisin
MASPHTAGMLAYLLSLYPSKTFHPDIESDLTPPVLDSVPQRAFNTMYTFARAALPQWVSAILPAPSSLLDAVAPTPKSFPVLTPAQLKKALLDLATRGVLTTLPAHTPNLLIFNNATTA